MSGLAGLNECARIDYLIVCPKETGKSPASL